MKLNTSKESLVLDPPAPKVTETKSGLAFPNAAIASNSRNFFSGDLGGYTSKDTGNTFDKVTILESPHGTLINLAVQEASQTKASPIYPMRFVEIDYSCVIDRFSES